jgi:AcrR family transcriptional regulator
MSMDDRRRALGSRSRAGILAAARRLIAGSDALPSVGSVAAAAGVSRLTVYHHFGSKHGLFESMAAVWRADEGEANDSRPESAVSLLRGRIDAACARWARDPALFRRLPSAAETVPGAARELAERLGAADQLRPGCSLKEAEDVIAVVTSFAAFDRLHGDGRRSTSAVAEILGRMAAAVLNPAA